MMKFIRFIFGYVKFKASGGFTERFINLCRISGIKLWNMQTQNDCFCAETSINDYRKIKTCAKKSGMSVRITQKSGLPFLYKSISNRIGLLLGIAIVCFCVFFYTRSVWVIDVQGNEKIPSEQIITLLSDNGLNLGTLKKNINNKKFKLLIYDEIPDIAWVNLNIDGSRLSVDVREAVEKPQNRDSDAVCNIVASKDGVIDKAVVYEGENQTIIGEGVTKGELLVSGVIYHESVKKTTFHRSRADIFAFTQAEKTVKVSKNQKKVSYTGKEKMFKELNIFRISFPLYIFTNVFESNEVSHINKPLKLGGKTLPISINYYNVKQTQVEKYKADVDNARTLARKEKNEFENSFSEGCKILSETENIKETDTDFYFTYTYKLYENIAQKSNIQIDDENIADNMEKNEK